MASFMSRKGRSRRTVNEINMVPFIDVMLVLLIILMVSAPMVTPGVINAPSVGHSEQTPPIFAQVIVDKTGKLEWKVGPESRSVDKQSLGQIAAQWQEEQLQAGKSPEQVAIVISGDKEANYDYVMQTLDILKEAGAKKVAFLLNKK